MEATTQTDAGLLARIKQSPWLVAAAVALGALVPALLMDAGGETFLGVAGGSAVYAAWAARRNDTARQEPFAGDGYMGSWVTHPDYDPSVMFVRIDLDSGEHCGMVSRLQGNAGALKLSSPGFTDDSKLQSGRGVGEKVHRVRRTSGGTIMTSTRTGSDTFEIAAGTDTFTITADKKSTPAETAAEMAALTQDLPAQLRVIAITYAASQQFLWLK